MRNTSQYWGEVYRRLPRRAPAGGGPEPTLLSTASRAPGSAWARQRAVHPAHAEVADTTVGAVELSVAGIVGRKLRVGEGRLRSAGPYAGGLLRLEPMESLPRQTKLRILTHLDLLLRVESGKE